MKKEGKWWAAASHPDRSCTYLCVFTRFLLLWCLSFLILYFSFSPSLSSVHTTHASWLSPLSRGVCSWMNCRPFQSRWIWSKPDAPTVRLCAFLGFHLIFANPLNACIRTPTPRLQRPLVRVCVSELEGGRLHPSVTLPPLFSLVGSVRDNKNISSKCLEWRMRRKPTGAEVFVKYDLIKYWWKEQILFNSMCF